MNLSFAHGFLAGRTVVVFGAGYIGGAVVRAAVAAGAEVVALTRNPATAAVLGSTGAKAVVADLAADMWHEQVPASVSFVLNAVSSGGGGLEGYRSSYLRGAESIVSWARARNVAAHLIYTGSTSVYAQDDGVRVDERQPAEANDERAQILRATEATMQRWPGPHTILRLAGIYGPDRHHLLDQLREGATELPGHGEHHLNLIHRDDIVAAILTAWARPEAAKGNIFNLADDGAATKAEVVGWLAARLGRSSPAFSGVRVPGRRAQVPDRIIANDAIKAALGWSPVFPSFREGYAALLGA